MKKSTLKPRKSVRRRKTAPTTQLMGFVTWTDPLRKPEMFVMEAPFDHETESACVHLDFNLRSVASIELRPARRPLKDTAGVVADALRLANT